MTPGRRPTIPLVPLLLGGLVMLALIGAALGGLGDHPVAQASSTPTPSLLVAGGSAWPALASASPTPSPTWAPTTPAATPTASPSVSRAIGLEVRVCRQQHAGRCDRQLDQVRDAFVVLVSFTDSSRGDLLSIRLDGPNGRRVDGATLSLGGGSGAAWSSFGGGLRAGSWAAVALLNGSEVARTTFVAR